MKRQQKESLVTGTALVAFLVLGFGLISAIQAHPNKPESVVPPNETQDSLPQNMPEHSRDLDKSKTPQRGPANGASGGGEVHRVNPNGGGSKGKRTIAP